MKIDKTFKINEKYFNAILRLVKPFELRHEKVEQNSIVKLECENGRYIIFESGKCLLLEKCDNIFENNTYGIVAGYTTDNYYPFRENYAFSEKNVFDYHKKVLVAMDYWYDNFCWEYINKAPTYLIEIAEILELK